MASTVTNAYAHPSTHEGLRPDAKHEGRGELYIRSYSQSTLAAQYINFNVIVYDVSKLRLQSREFQYRV